MFSVIIPLYNKELYIQRTINSVLNQTFKQFEIVIVDDGSTDNSVGIVKKMSDSRIKLFCKENNGVSSARNYGINKASYGFLAFLDADDLWLDDYLESINLLIEKYPGCGMYGTGRYDDVNGQRNAMISTLQKGADFIIADYCLKPYIINTSSMCIKKTVINKAGLFNPKLVIGEDIDFKLRIACHFAIAYFNAPKTVYYIGMENNSFSKKANSKGMFHFFKWYFYPYKNKYSLFVYTTKKIIEMFTRAYFHSLYKHRIPNNNKELSRQVAETD